MKKTISQDDYLRLVGREREQADHCRALDDIERSACGLLGQEPGDGGHIGDVVYGGHQWSPVELLRLLGITVEQPSTTPEQENGIEQEGAESLAAIDGDERERAEQHYERKLDEWGL